MRRKSVQFCWVPGHVGIPGNERVDDLARLATTSSLSPSLSIPVSDFFPAFAALLQRRWQQSWATAVDNKLHTVKPSVMPWSAPFHRIRRWETALARLRIGHTRLTHGFLMSKDPPPVCPRCTSCLTVSHILIECPFLATIRSRIFPFLSSLGRPPTVRDLLDETCHFSISALMRYLDCIGVLAHI